MIACSVSSWIGPPEIFHVKDNASGTTEVSQILPNWPNFRARWNILPSWMFWLFEMSPMRLKKYIACSEAQLFPTIWRLATETDLSPQWTWSHYARLCSWSTMHHALCPLCTRQDYVHVQLLCTRPTMYSFPLCIKIVHVAHISMIQNRTTIHFYKTDSHRNLNYFECAKFDKLPIYQWPSSQYTSNV